jgi:hypothetical protein
MVLLPHEISDCIDHGAVLVEPDTVGICLTGTSCRQKYDCKNKTGEQFALK